MTPGEFVASLRARGVTVSVRSNRLWLTPGATWRQLTVDETQCIAEHRAAIKHLVNEPIPPPVPRAPTERTTKPATPKPPHVYSVDCERFVTAQDLIDAGIVGRDRVAYERAREWLQEQVREERSKRATATMFESLRRQQRGTHGGYR